MSGTYYPSIRRELEVEASWLAHWAEPSEEELLFDPLLDPPPYRDEQLLLWFYDELEPTWDD